MRYLGLLVSTCLAVTLQAQSRVLMRGTYHADTRIHEEGNYLQLAANGLFSVGLRNDGTTAGWGDNASGQATPPTPTIRMSRIAAGLHVTMGLQVDGSLRCWGSPSLTFTPPAGLTIQDFAAGWMHVVAVLSDGSIRFLAGSSQYGLNNVPALPANLRYTQVACGDNHCVAIRSDGQVIGWGRNSFGQCIAPPLPPRLTYVSVAAGYETSVARRSDGTLHVFGRTLWQAPTLPPGLTWRTAAVGYQHILGLRSDGQVVG